MGEQADHCAVCADVLRFVASGPCGHREACHTCTARLRFVCKDTRCIICKQECPLVFVTRAAGSLTNTLPAGEFDTLPSRAARGGDLFVERHTDMYFDDEAPCKAVTQLLSLSCVLCIASSAAAGAAPPPQFPSLSSLQHHLRTEHKQHMCNICLQGRNVFISQQILYSKNALDKHMISGGADVGNPLGQAGFKGHPMCKFCILHFFDDGQLYVHMQREHFQCFLCQRIAPDSTNPVYYKNYPELEQHFKLEHSMCDHPACLEKKFVAFASPMELQRHMALEHKGELSKDARKQALRANDLLGFVTPSGPGMQPAMPMIQRGRGTRSGVASAAVTQLGISADQLARLRAQARAEAASAEAAARARATLIDDSAPTPAESYGNGSSIPRSASGNDMAANAGPSLSTAARWSAAATVGRIVPTDDVNSFPSLQRSSSSSAVQTQQTGAMSGAPRSLARRIGGEGHGAPGVRNVARMPPAAAPQAAMPSLFGAASSSSGGASSISNDEGVRAANAALSRRIQNMLPLVTRDEDFARMRQLSARFRDGQLSGSQYYASIQAMGLAPCVPELAALLPDAGKRRELMEAAASASASVPTARVGATAASVAAQAQLRAGGVRVLTPAWTCGACTLNNAAGNDTCSACGGRRRPSEGEGVSALAVALEAAMRTGKGRDKKYGGGVQIVGGAPVPFADFPQPTRAPPPQPVPAASHESLASAFPALPSAAPSSGAAPLGARRKRNVGVSPGNQWTQGRPM